MLTAQDNEFSSNSCRFPSRLEKRDSNESLGEAIFSTASFLRECFVSPASLVPDSGSKPLLGICFGFFRYSDRSYDAIMIDFSIEPSLWALVFIARPSTFRDCLRSVLIMDIEPLKGRAPEWNDAQLLPIAIRTSFIVLKIMAL